MIPLFNIKPDKNEIKRYLSQYKKNLIRADFIQGKDVKKLEKKLSNFIGIKYTQTCANGTDALYIALCAIKKKNIKKKLILTTPMSWISSSNAILNAGFTPLYSDISRENFNLETKLIKTILEKYKNTIAGVLSVDLFGCPNDNDKIFSICRKLKVPFIVDGAQSFGAKINKKSSFNYCDIATTSFFPTKPLGCFGDGGAIFTNNKKLYHKIKSLCFNGQGKSKNNFKFAGTNSRLDEVQASILLNKLKKLNQNISMKKKLFNFFKENLNSKYYIQDISKNKASAYSLCSVLVQSKKQRSKVMNLLAKQKIQSGIYYQKLLNEHGYVKKKSLIVDNLKNSYYVRDRVLSLPFYINLNFSRLRKIVSILNKI